MTADTTTLVGWLREQLDQDERVALAATPGPWSVSTIDGGSDIIGPGRLGVAYSFAGNGCTSPDDGDHMALHDPQAVLADVEAKRKILELHSPNEYGICETCMSTEIMAAGDCGCERWPCETVLALTSAYRPRPGFDPSWLPEGME